MNGSEGDSEQKKWGQKRQQFDAVVSTARLNGAIDGLIQGTIEPHALVQLLDELNSAQSQRGRYMAEILALKMESRRLLSAPFNQRVAEFLIEGARRIPWLSDGLASQLAVALGSAADNPLYLDTVNTAISNLLLDVTRPLKPDTRNYLRALTDKIIASRKLQEARGHLAIVPSVYPAAIPQPLSGASAPDATGFAPLVPEETPAQSVDPRSSDVSVGVSSEPDKAEPPRQDPDPAESAPAVHPAVPHREKVEVAPPKQDPAGSTSTTPATAEPSMPAGKTTPGIGLAAGSSTHKAASDKRPSPHATAPSDTTRSELAHTPMSDFAAVPAAHTALSDDASGTGADDWADLEQEELEADQLKHRRRGGIPIWILVIGIGAIAAVGIGIWLFARGGSKTSVSPALNSAAASGAAQQSKPARERKAKGAPSVVAPNAAPTAAPAAPPAAAQPTAVPPAAVLPAAVPPTPTTPPKAAPPAPATPAVKTTTTPAVHSSPPPKPVAPSAVVSKPPSVAASPKPPQQPPPPVYTKPPSKPIAESPVDSTPTTPRTPTPSRTVDDIIVELLKIPNDAASIESKAHEVARVVARSSRNDAEIILRRLIPEEVLAGTETVDTRTLEPVRRVVALLLKKVALDKDDTRAALAIETLGEWAKLRKHGAAAKLTLDELAEERVVLSRPKRLQALERVQSRLGISNAGE